MLKIQSMGKLRLFAWKAERSMGTYQRIQLSWWHMGPFRRYTMAAPSKHHGGMGVRMETPQMLPW